MGGEATSALSQLSQLTNNAPRHPTLLTSPPSITGRLASGSSPLPPNAACTLLFAFLYPIHVFLCKAQPVCLGIVLIELHFPCENRDLVCHWMKEFCLFEIKIVLISFPVHEFVARCFCLGTFYIALR